MLFVLSHLSTSFCVAAGVLWQAVAEMLTIAPGPIVAEPVEMEKSLPDSAGKVAVIVVVCRVIALVMTVPLTWPDARHGTPDLRACAEPSVGEQHAMTRGEIIEPSEPKAYLSTIARREPRRRAG